MKIKLTALIAFHLMSFCLFAQSDMGLSASQQDSILSLTQSGGCPIFTIVTSTMSPTCNDFLDGSVTVDEPLDGVGPYLYQWVGGPNSQTWSGLGAGTYTIIVIDVGQSQSCSQDVFLNEPGDLTVFDMQAVAPSCFGVCDGQANPIVIGGNGGYMFSYDSGENTQMASMLCEPFMLTITDMLGCILDTTFTFPDAPDPIVVDAVVTDIDCNSNDNGSIEITISGGTSPYDINWVGPMAYSSTNEDIFNLEPGIYTLNILDANLCPFTANYEISEPDEIMISETHVDNVCFGDGFGSIDVTVTGGTPDYSFSWTGPGSFTSTNEDITDLESGFYNLTVTDDNGCQEMILVEIESPDELMIDAIVSDITCFGFDNGSIDLTTTGGIGPYNFNWTGPPPFMSISEDIGGLEPGDYTIVITDQNLCTIDSTFTILEPDELLLDAMETDVSCDGEMDGAIDLTINGGTAPFMISWVGPVPFMSTDEDLTNLESGTYTATVTDANDCVAVLVVVIDEPNPINVNPNITNESCGGAMNGAIQITVSGGTPPYDFAWTGPGAFTSTDEDIFMLSEGDYDLVITDDNDCTFMATYTVNEDPGFDLFFVVTDIECFGDNTGAIDMTIVGGIPLFDVMWTGPGAFSSTAQDISNLEAGTYSVSVTDDTGCNRMQDVEVMENDSIELTFMTSDPTCNGAMDGSIDMEIIGGVPPYDISWVGPGTFTSMDEDLTMLSAGLYAVTVTDAFDCVQFGSVMLDDPPAITIDEILTDLICNEDSSGSIEVTISNATNPLNISWTGPGGFTSLDEDIFDLAAGMYTIDVIDANLCTATESYTLFEPDTIDVLVSITDISCLALNSGAIELDISGGTPDYSVSWTGPGAFTSMDEDIFMLIAGTYTYLITDDNGCTYLDSATVQDVQLVTLDAVLDQILCNGDDDGSIDLSILTGTAPFDISWVGPGTFTSTDEDISNLEPGTYMVTVTDVNDCSETASYDITEPALLELDVDITLPSCGVDDGELTANVTGGTMPYDYSWSFLGGPFIDNVPTISMLSTGIYEIIVIDFNDCVVGDTIALSNPQITVNETITDVSCPGGNDGSIELEVFTLNPPLTFSWTGPGVFTSTDEDIFMLEAGLYTVDIEDDANCTASFVYEVGTSPSITITGVVTDVSCPGAMDGAIDVTITNAVDPYTTNWTGPGAFTSIDEDISMLDPGMYNITVMDGNGCIESIDFEVMDATGLDLDFVVTEITCVDSNDGAIDMEINNGLAPYIITWNMDGSFFSNDEDISMLGPGEYSVDVVDANLCTAQDTILLMQADSILNGAIIIPVNCADSSDGSITLNALAGTAPYMFSWTGPGAFSSADQDISDLISGEYILTVTDADLCVEVDTFFVPQPNPIDATFDILNPTCLMMNGSITAFVTGGTVAVDYTYLWEDSLNMNIGNTNVLPGVGAGVYTLTVTDDNLCTAVFEVTLSDDDITVDAIITDVTCNGLPTGSIEITINGATDPVAITWSGPSGFMSSDEDIFNLAVGTYDLSITDGLGCAFFESYEISEPDDITVNETIVSPLCFEEMTGSIEIDVLGGVPDYTFAWTGPGTFVSSDEDIFNLAGGTYNLVITDDGDCTASFSFDLNIPSEIQTTEIISDPLCAGVNDGFIDITVTGGEMPYTFLWTGQGTFTSMDEDIMNLEAGDYTVIISDNFDCSESFTFTLENNTEIILDADITDVSCFGEDDGAIDLTIIGGTSPYDISWNGPGTFTSTDEDLTNLAPGMYDVQVSDQLSCIVLDTFEITEPDTIDVVIDITNPSCWYLNDGAFDITISGGTEPYDISWFGPNSFTSSDEDISDLEDGDYTLIIVDANLCTWEDDYSLIAPTAIEVFLDSISNPLCDVSTDGEIFITAIGGIGDLIFDWTGPGFSSTDEDISGLVEGVYNLTITDDFSCVLDTSFTLVGQMFLMADAGVYPEFCDGDTVILDGSASIGAVTFEWSEGGNVFSNDPTTELIVDINTGPITLTIFNGPCSNSETIDLIVNELPFVDAGDDIEGFAEEEIEIGGDPTTDPGNNVVWMPDLNLDDDTLLNPTVLLSEDQVYSVTVTSPDGCVNSDSMYVDVLFPINITNTITPNGDGINEEWVLDGSIAFPNMEMEIFNRWGEELFQSAGYDVPWDGTYEGKMLPSGTYYYIIRLNDPQFPDPLTGPITILR